MFKLFIAFWKDVLLEKENLVLEAFHLKLIVAHQMFKSLSYKIRIVVQYPSYAIF